MRQRAGGRRRGVERPGLFGLRELLAVLMGLGCTLALVGCGRGVVVTPSLEPSEQGTPSSSPTVRDGRFGAVFLGPKITDPNLPCAELRSLGVQSSFFGAWWGLLEPSPGRYDWSSVDAVVDAALSCGLEPVIKITTAARPGKDASPPQDMAAYARFVFHLAQHLKGRVRAYAVENEIDRVQLSHWTAEIYGSVRATAYRSIKQADPAARVLDSGMTMQAYLVARADELLQSGNEQAALDMLRQASQSIRRKPVSFPATAARLNVWLNRPEARRGAELVRELYGHPDTFDAVQLHFLQDAWDFLPEYVSWVRAWTDKPFEFWEIGYGWEGAEFSEEDHAAGVVKTLVVALGEGADRAIYEPYAEGSNNVGRGLVSASGPRPAAIAYQVMVRQLAGYAGADRIDLGPGMWCYRFAVPTGDVYVMWVGAGSVGGPRAVSLPITADQVTVVDIAGRAQKVDVTALVAGPAPLFVRVPGGHGRRIERDGRIQGA